jgi:hypothetical protein
VWVRCHELSHSVLIELLLVRTSREGFVTPSPSVRPAVSGQRASLGGGFPAAASRVNVSCIHLLKVRGGPVYAMPRAYWRK